MEKNQSLSKGTYWILFFVSLAIMVWLLMFHSNWFWVDLPFLLTFLVKAMDVV